MSLLGKFFSFNNSDRLLLIKVFILLGATRVGLKFLPFYWVSNFVDRLAHPQAPLPYDDATIQRIIWAITRVSPYLRATCLPQALVAKFLLDRRNYPNQLQIGFIRSRVGQISAHAWVDSHGKTIVGESGEMAKYIPVSVATLKSDQTGSWQHLNNPTAITQAEFTPILPLWFYKLQKNAQLAVKTRKDIEILLVTRALQNEGFRQELLARPKQVIEQELSTLLPENLEIQVWPEASTTRYLILPCNPYADWSETDLQNQLQMTATDVAQGILEQQRNSVLEGEKMVSLIAQTWYQKGFKQLLLANAHRTIQENFGVEISANIDLKILVETPEKLYIVIPNSFDDFVRSNLAEIKLSTLSAAG